MGVGGGAKVLEIVGEEDKCITPGLFGRFSSKAEEGVGTGRRGGRKMGEVLFVKGAGHWPHLESPGAVREGVFRHLTGWKFDASVEAVPDVVGVMTKEKAGGAKVLSMDLNSAATTPSSTPPPPPTDQEEVAAEEVVAPPVVVKTEAELAKLAKANKKKREAKKRAAEKKAAALLNPPMPDASALSVQDEARFSDID